MLFWEANKISTRGLLVVKGKDLGPANNTARTTSMVLLNFLHRGKLHGMGLQSTAKI